VLATLRSVSKGRNHGFADRDKSRAWPFDAGALATYAGTFEKQRQGIGEQIGLCDPGGSAKPRQAVALRRLECLDDASRRMIALSQLNRRIGYVAAAAIADRALCAATNPSMKLRKRVTGIGGLKPVPDRLGVSGDLAKAGDDQIILRPEVPIQGHLVGPRRIGDRINADPSDPMFAKQIPGRADDAFPRLRRGGWAILHDLSSTLKKLGTSLDLGVTGL
jgi:hypothetical protein